MLQLVQFPPIDIIEKISLLERNCKGNKTCVENVQLGKALDFELNLWFPTTRGIGLNRTVQGAGGGVVLEKPAYQILASYYVRIPLESARL